MFDWLFVVPDEVEKYRKTISAVMRTTLMIALAAMFLLELYCGKK